MSVICISSKASRPRSIGDGGGHGRERVFDALLAGGVHPGVDFLHEGMEMHPAGGHVGTVSTKRSISIDLPRPTPPQR